MAAHVAAVVQSGHDNWVRGLVWHPNGKFLLSVGDDKSLAVWDLASGRLVKRISEAHPHFVTTIASSDRHPVIATGGVDTSVRIWECV